MNSAASVTQFAHKCILEYFSLLIGTLVRTKVRYDTEDSDCKRGDNLLQRGTIYSKVDYPRGPPTLGARLLRDISTAYTLVYIFATCPGSPTTMMCLNHVTSKESSCRSPPF